jgi:Lectin C-type domain
VAVAAIVSCRFRYEELASSGDGGVATNGGDTSSGDRSGAAALGGVPGTEGGAGNSQDGGAAGNVDLGGTGAAPGGGNAGTTANGGTNIDGGTNTGGSGAGAGGAPSTCVPDATCACEELGGHEYRFCSVLTTRTEGLAACQAAGMSLIRVDTAEENAWLLQQFIDHGMFVGAGGPVVFLGGRDTQVAGEWRWEDGTLFWNGAPVGTIYTNWSTPPKNSQGDCVGMSGDGKWVSRSCNTGNATTGCESL